ncbi:MAG: SsrA-binding protein SmpB [Nitrospina sp.]|jgi:SsrA-binding protein|nr:SsrA-binding protein SmpB [Nitrospina sp.]MBT6716447.1 SsrA-binding protein SmpB [Nitrospina sp.]
MTRHETEGIKIVCQNKKARHNYTIEDTFEAGLVLRGTEVKSLRNGKANLVDSYATINGEEAWLNHLHIDPYTPATQFNHHPMRKRKLLLHKKEINKLIGKTQEKGCTLVPLKIYFKNGKAKVDLGIAKAKKLFDKRATLKKQEADREIDRAIKDRNR